MVHGYVEGPWDVEGSFPGFRENVWLEFLKGGYWVLNICFDGVDDLNLKNDLR